MYKIIKVNTVYSFGHNVDEKDKIRVHKFDYCNTDSLSKARSLLLLLNEDLISSRDDISDNMTHYRYEIVEVEE